MTSISRPLSLGSSAFLALSAVTSADTYYWVGGNTNPTHTVFNVGSWSGGYAPPTSRNGTELHFEDSPGALAYRPTYSLEGGAIRASRVLFNRVDTNGFTYGRLNLGGEFKNTGTGIANTSYSADIRLSGNSLVWAEKG